MPTAFTFTPAQLTEITRLANIAKLSGSAAVGAYAPMYNYIAQAASDFETAEFRAGRTPDPAIHLTWVWFTGAVGVNSNQGAFSSIIRQFNIREGQLRYGRTFSDAELQTASNEVGKNIFEQIAGSLPPAGTGNGGKLPTVKEIGDQDLRGVRNTLYLAEATTELQLNQAWPGILMLGKLGVSYTENLLKYNETDPVQLNTLGDIKNVLFAWESFRYAFENTSITDLNVRDLRVALNIDGLADVLTAGTSAKLWFEQLIGTQNPIAAIPLNLVATYGSEAILDMLRSTYTGTPISNTTPATFQGNAVTFFSGAAAQLQTPGLELLTNKSVSALVTLATGAEKYRNALQSLSIFALDLPSYAGRNLELYNEATGTGSLTKLYLQDRAAMLTWKIKYDSGARDDDGLADDFFRTGNKPYTAEWDSIRTSGDWDFIDKSSGITLAIDGLDVSTMVNHKIVFGSGNSDVLTGDSLVDHLYGGAGADTLTGGGSNDYLEGGAGSDTYAITSGDGYDTLLDTDGSGSIIINGVTLTGGKLVVGTTNVWKDTAQGYTYTLKGSGASQVLLIGRDGSSDGLRVQGWQSGQLGLAMLGAAAPTANSPLIGVDGYSDALTGGGGADLIQGLSGNDALDGSGGDDVIEGGVGDDLISGNAGSDLIYGGAGKDMILSATGLNLPGRIGPSGQWEAPAGRAVWTQGRVWGIYASTDANGDVYIIDGGGSLSQDSAPDYVFSGDDDDRVIGGLGADYIDGGLNNDNLTGHGGNDVIDGGDGDDYIQSDGIILPGYYTSVAEILHGNDVLDGGAGVDTLVGGGRDDGLFGGIGNDKLWGDGQSETYLGGAYHGADYLDGGADDDQLTGGGRDDTLIGGQGADMLWGDADDEVDLAGLYHGNDYLDGGDGDDQLVGGGGNDILVGGIGIDLLFGDARDGVILTAPYQGDDILYGEAGNDQLTGGGGNDDLYGGADSDTLLGESGTDILDGGLGIDYLDGGTGADIMAGGADDDSYIVDDVGDVVIEAAGEGIDTINSSASITLPNNVEWLNLTGAGNIDATGNADANNLTGNAGANRLEGMAGNDQLIGGEGGDTLIGDEGVDALYGDAGTDTLNGGSGNDQLIGGAGADILIGGTGDDYYGIDDAGDTITEALGEGTDFVRSSVSYTLADNLEGLALDGAAALVGTGNALNNSLFGSLANNTLYGGTGNDYLLGDAGNDVYVFNRGDGQDSIDNTDLLSATDILRFGAGVSDTDVLGFQVGADMVLNIKGTTEQVAFINYYGADTVNGSLVSDHKIDRVEFSNGVIWDQTMIQTIVDRAANNNAPIINTYLPALQAVTGSLFSYSVPNGAITDPDAWDSIAYSVTMPDRSAIPSWLMFDAATQTLSGTPGVINLGSLQFMLWGTDNYGYSIGQTVTLNVGVPNYAPIVSAALPDQTAFQGTAFSYTVAVTAFSDPDVGDVLNYSATLSDGSALPLWLSFNATTRTFSGTPSTLGTTSVRVTARDSGNLTAADVFDITVGVPGLVLNGTGGADFLYGSSGNDIFDGGLGNDTLQGISGDDLYLFAAGDGQDTIGEMGGSADILRFKAGIQPGEIKLLRWYAWDNWGKVEDSLRLIRLNPDGSDTQDFVHIKNYFLSLDDSSRVDRIEFSDGTVWTYADVQAKLLAPTNGAETLEGFAGVDVINGLGGNDSINGKAGDDILSGGDGDDDLQGGLGNDTLLGGAGNDRLLGYGVWLNDTSAVNNDAGDDILYGGTGTDRMFGGKGNDTYLFGRGDGYDYVGDTPNVSGASLDILRLGAGVLPEHVTLYQFDTRDLMVVIDGSNQQILLSNYYLVDSNGVADWSIERIEFDGGVGAVWTAANIASRVTVGLVNSMAGTAGNDTFIVDHVFDTITEAANAGIDTVLASQTYTLPTNVENLTLTGVLNINATGNALNNILRGNGGDNIFTANGGSDIAYGGRGDDTYRDLTPVELVDEGIDTWVTIYGGVLPENVENMNLNNGSGSYVNGTASAIGNALDNILIGRSNVGVIGQDILDGRAGADTMLPGQYTTVYVDNPGDKVIGAGYEIRSSIDYVLPEPLRYTGNNTYILNSVTNRLVLIGSSPINGKGNAINNVLIGHLNEASNMLSGGAGDDIYVVALNDRVVEAVGEGSDLAYLWLPSTLDNGREIRITDLAMGNVEGYVLAGNANNVTLRGDGSDNVLRTSLNFWGSYQSTLRGEGGSDRLLGGVGSDLMDGGAGADEMSGGAGNDFYIVDNVGDQVIEYTTFSYSTYNDWEYTPYYSWNARDGGADLVESSVTYTLAPNVENLTLTGTIAINGTGNILVNTLTGNSAANILDALAGNDTLTGNEGNDTLTGGAGADSFTDTALNLNGDSLTDFSIEDLIKVSNLRFGSYRYTSNTGLLELDTQSDGSFATDLQLSAGLVGEFVVTASALDQPASTLVQLMQDSDGDGVGDFRDNSILVANPDQRDTDGDGYGNITDADLNQDQVVDLFDLSILDGVYGSNDANADFNGDGTVDLFDLSILDGLYGAPPGLSYVDNQVASLVAAMASFAPPAAGQMTLPPTYQTSQTPVIAANSL